MSLHELRGKVVVLNFWATWCGPCKAETPLLVAADHLYRKQGVIFLGVSVDAPRTQSNIPAFLDHYHVEYIIGVSASDDDLKKMGLGIAVPATAFIGRDGRIRERVLGQIRPEELNNRIEWLLHGEIGTAPQALVTHLDISHR